MTTRSAIDQHAKSVRIHDIGSTGDILKITWDDGAVSRFNSVWLRHNSQDEKTVQLSTVQKHIDIDQLDPETRITEARLTGSDEVEIHFEPDGHQSRFSAEWLFASKYDYNGDLVNQSQSLQLWGGELLNALPSFSWPKVVDDYSVRSAWYTAVIELGFAILHDVPAETRYIERVIESFGKVRENRIGRTFDVKFIPDPSNLAFTAAGLSLHTDNPYRNPVPGLQLLHCLQNSAVGGDSVVTDGFKAAQLLQAEDPKHYDLISTVDVLFRYKTSETWFEEAAPLIALNSRGRPKHIRYNNRSMVGPLASISVVNSYYEALRHFDEILRRPSLNVVFKMGAGDLFIVDNHRVLHGRTEFSATEPRLLQGAYSEIDWMESRYRLARENPLPLAAE